MGEDILDGVFHTLFITRNHLKPYIGFEFVLFGGYIKEITGGFKAVGV